MFDRQIDITANIQHKDAHVIFECHIYLFANLLCAPLYRQCVWVHTTGLGQIGLKFGDRPQAISLELKSWPKE